MSIDTARPRSRRALLGAAFGAAAATVAAALPSAARTTPTDVTGYLKVDDTNSASGITELTGGTLKVARTHDRTIDASSGDGRAVHANGGTGFAVYAYAPNGWALSTHGRLDISTAGLTTIPAGATTKKVYGGVDITSASFVLLTPGTDIGSRRLWWTKDTADNSITIHLSSSRSSSTKVSWLLLG